MAYIQHCSLPILSNIQINVSLDIHLIVENISLSIPTSRGNPPRMLKDIPAKRTIAGFKISSTKFK
jgi:hypothetical protein